MTKQNKIQNQNINQEKKNKKKKEISRFLEENKKKIKIALIAIFATVIIVIIYFIFLNLRFSIKDDIVIEIPERHIAMNITRESPAELEIYSNVQTSIFCKASCTQKLININSNEIVFSESFEFRQFHRISLDKTLYPYVLGEGQDVYSYSISCSNIATANCPVKEETIEKDIIITLTRNLTEKEKNLKNSQESRLNYAYTTYNKGLSQLDSSENILNNITYAKKDDLENNFKNMLEKRNKFNNLLSRATDAWLTYNHSFIEQTLKIENFDSSTEDFGSSMSNILNETMARIENHNAAVYQSYSLDKKILDSKNILLQSRQFLEDNYNFLDSNLKEANSLLLFSSKKIYNKDFETYAEIFEALKEGNMFIDSFEYDYLDYIINNTVFAKAQLDLLITQEDNCLILGNATNTEAYTKCSKNFSNLLVDYSNITYDYLSSNITSFCSDYDNAINTKNSISKESYKLRANLSNLSLAEINNESAAYRIYTLKKHRQELISRNDSSADYAVGIINKYIRSIESEYGISEGNVQADTFNLAPNSTLFNLFIPINFTFQNITGCDSLKTESSALNLSYEEYNLSNLKPEQINYNYTLPELLPRACYDGKCKPYIHNSSTNYPLIIVHGHSFYSQNFRITPSQVHNELINHLVQDKLYISAGMLKEDDPILADSLGFIDAPFVYKAGYYPEEVLNNESINLFADRLNKIILNAKEETGKDKVIILCHSMGGLITRAYMKKYGTDDVEFVIIGGTPNYGVPYNTVPICKLFGRNLECDEMYEKSSFISELKTEPKYNIPIYTLRGEGCSTFGEDGDGVVPSKSVPLSYAENFAFNGTCSATGGFHINLLNPEQNPEIYNKIKEILAENRK